MASSEWNALRGSFRKNDQNKIVRSKLSNAMIAMKNIFHGWVIACHENDKSLIHHDSVYLEFKFEANKERNEIHKINHFRGQLIVHNRTRIRLIDDTAIWDYFSELLHQNSFSAGRQSTMEWQPSLASHHQIPRSWDLEFFQVNYELGQHALYVIVQAGVNLAKEDPEYLQIASAFGLFSVLSICLHDTKWINRSMCIW